MPRRRQIYEGKAKVLFEGPEPGTIVQEIQKGFTMKDRLLRPSLVGVSKKKSDKETDNNKKDKENQEKKDQN